ncbi:helix-turn-helix domain-containing protein [Mucilaginibacter glaciei]|uniref:AraC family transcriptional regulator n=1 Tax=Mucilaginibacter glaciei TaxID=2772109 RepID=A0A926NSK6_9SPHI|nr:helix-turn-helix domain-containing protein [Mucilaginibacter glaciei]MBD1393950.1 AraC family transcriptional regulator [Mucilaginibacter glaciei]
MKIDFGINVILFLVAIIIGLFSAALLLSSAKNKTANRLLALLMLAITGWIVDAFFRASGIYGQRSDLYFLPIYYSFAFGPLLYFYVQAITNASFSFKYRYLLHFIPVFLQAVFYWSVIFTSYQTKYYIWFNIHQPYTYRIEYDGTWLSMIIYLILSIGYLKNYRQWLKQNYSNITRKMLNWLNASLVILFMVCIAWLFEAYLRDFSGIYYKYDFSGNLLCIVVICIGILGYLQSNLDLSFVPQVSPSEEKASSFVADATVIQLIEDALAKNKLYLNPELTLTDVAKHLALPAKTISANVNAGFGKPFNTYINTYRVNEVKRRLAANDAAKLTLLGIAYESGFNSKTSFNRIFKEFTGQSPSDYLKK